MLKISICVDAPIDQVIGIKELIANDLEKYGKVQIVCVDEVEQIQLKECR